MYEVWEKGREKKTFIETVVFAAVKKKSYCTRHKWDSLCGIIAVFGHRSIFYQYQ